MNSRFDMIYKILCVIIGCATSVISSMSTGDAFVLYGMEAFFLSYLMSTLPSNLAAQFILHS